MNRKVSGAEVALLHEFCKKHYVNFYDVRLELVDHLASSIEELWEKEPELSFEKALEKIYSSYGNMGFRNLMREKEIQVERSIYKGYRRVLSLFFTWPHVFLTLILLLLFYLIYTLGLKLNIYIPPVFIGLFVLFNIVFGIGIDVFVSRRNKKLREPLIALPYGRLFVTNFSLILPVIIFSSLLEGESIDVNLFRDLLYFGFLSLMLIVELLLNIAFFRYYRNIYKEAEALYPDAFKAITAG